MDESRIKFYLDAGKKDKFWYADTEKLLVEIYGREYLPLVARLLAATSINTSLPANITLFRRALHELENNIPFSNYLPNIKQQLENVKHGRPLSGPKINAFANAIMGDKDAVVVDVWLLRAFDLDKKYMRNRNGKSLLRSSGASVKNFIFVQDYLRTLAHTLDLEPRQVSAMVWSGVRKLIGKNANTRYHETLQFKLYNMYGNKSN